MKLLNRVRRLFFLLCVGLIAPQVHGQLAVNVDVDVTQGADGLYTYVYTLENTAFSLESINTFFFSTPRGADISFIAGPNDNWFAGHEPLLTPSNLQGTFITGFNADGTECGVDPTHDITPGSSAEFTLVSSWAPGILENVDTSAIGRTVGELCLFAGSQAEPVFEVPAIPPPLVNPGPACDFDGDGDCDVRDIDNLGATISGNLSDLDFDLTSDNVVNTDDLAEFLQQVERLNGDADLNGQVDFNDFLKLSTNFSQEADWSGGDFDASGSVTFLDFLTLSQNFGQAFAGGSAVATSVPEPSGSLLTILSLLGLSVVRRRR